MDNTKQIHILGIGGCACSAIAEYLAGKGAVVTGSEMKPRTDLGYLESAGIKIDYQHDGGNVTKYGTPDVLLYSPAIKALNPNNPELLEANRLSIPSMSWEEFIGEYLVNEGRSGVTVSGSEGKGTTAGILTSILKGTDYDPLSILGAQMINEGESDSNIYVGNGSTYILEGDEYNRNFHSYHPDINVMINFAFEHPETYRDFDDYKKSFAHFFAGMRGKKKLIFQATDNTVAFAREYNLTNITWFGFEKDLNRLEVTGDIFTIKDHRLTSEGNYFTISGMGCSQEYFIPALPGYICLNATGAILAAMELGLDTVTIAKNITRFKGMKRRFEVYRGDNEQVVITDYGHSPESISHIIGEIKAIYPERKLHLVFQPHLYSRTYNFLGDFASTLAKADKISIIDIYPARENTSEWEGKISSLMLTEAVSKQNSDCHYIGNASCVATNLADIDSCDVICFMGAGDMDRYYLPLIKKILKG